MEDSINDVSKEWEEAVDIIEQAKAQKTYENGYYCVSNKWEAIEKDQWRERYRKSNYGFTMDYSIEETHVDYDGSFTPVPLYQVRCYVHTNSPLADPDPCCEHAEIHIDSYQSTYETKEEAEALVASVYEDYAHLLDDLHPVIPERYAKPFIVDGKPLPGFIIEGREQINEQTKPTLKEKMAKAKQTVSERKVVAPACREPCKER